MAGKTVSAVGLVLGCIAALPALICFRFVYNPPQSMSDYGLLIITFGATMGVAIAGSVCSVIGAVKGSELGIAGLFLNVVWLVIVTYVLILY